MGLKKPAQSVPVVWLKFFGVVLLLRGRVLADGLVVEQVVRDIANCLLQALLEFLEILLIEEDLVFVVRKGAVSFLTALAFRDGQVIVVIAFCGFYIEKIRALSGAYGFGINVFGVTLLAVRPFKIFTVQLYYLRFFNFDFLVLLAFD